MSYSAARVCRILDVKDHVLRYWAGEIPLVQPQKDKSGRLVFTGRDLRILLRLKHLLYGRHFTIEGARKQIERELSGDAQDLRSELDALRSCLISLLPRGEEEEPL